MNLVQCDQQLFGHWGKDENWWSHYFLKLFWSTHGLDKFPFDFVLLKPWVRIYFAKLTAVYWHKKDYNPSCDWQMTQFYEFYFRHDCRQLFEFNFFGEAVDWMFYSWIKGIPWSISKSEDWTGSSKVVILGTIFCLIIVILMTQFNIFWWQDVVHILNWWFKLDSGQYHVPFHI